MDAGQLQLHLAQANRRIVEIKNQIVSQRKLIADLAHEGRETNIAEDFLKRLKESLAASHHRLHSRDKPL